VTDNNVNPNPRDGIDGAEPLPSPEADPVVQLAHLIPALWRTMRRATRTATQLPANESQVTILRMLVLTGDRSPSELADQLHIARPTLSNLLKDLVRTNLVARHAAEGDNRSFVLSATPAGREVLETFRRDRAEALRSALARLPAEEQERVRLGVPALRHLQRELEVVADEAAQNDSETA
jgi:DNA-binding MarR family transcriptional regulator